jgi:hypothetical protein
MNRKLFALSVGLLTLGAAHPLLAQELPFAKELPSRAAIELKIEAQQQADAAAEKKAVVDVKAETAAYNAKVSTFRYETSNGPSPLFTNPGDAQGILLPANAVYAQSQVGTFGAPTAEWLALGNSPFPGGATSPYGLRLNWDSALGVFNLVDKGVAGQKDLVIGFGGNTADALKFNFFPSVTSSTANTVVSFSSKGVIRNSSGVRSGSESGTTQKPTVTSTSYIGLVNRRINDNSFLIAGRVMARTDTLILERDGTTAGLRINNPAGTALFPVVTCTGITSVGTLVTSVFGPPVGLTTLFATGGGIDAQGIISVDCSFGDPFGLNNITKVHLLRYPSDYFWVGTVTSSFNQ